MAIFFVAEKERLQQHCAEEKARCKSLEIKLEACKYLILPAYPLKLE